MNSLLKKELFLQTTNPLFFLFFVPMGYVMNLPPLMIVLTVLFLIMANAFYYEHKNKINIFFKSLPVKAKEIVFAKYVVLYIVVAILVIYLWIVDALAHKGLPYLDGPPLSSLKIGLILLSSSFFFSVSAPAFYFIRSFMKAATFIVFLLAFLAFGFAITIGNERFPVADYFLFGLFYLLDFQPLLVSSLISLICVTASYFTSTFIFMKKDCS